MAIGLKMLYQTYCQIVMDNQTAMICYFLKYVNDRLFFYD